MIAVLGGLADVERDLIRTHTHVAPARVTTDGHFIWMMRANAIGRRAEVLPGEEPQRIRCAEVRHAGAMAK